MTTPFRAALTHLRDGRLIDVHCLVQDAQDDPSLLGAWLHGIVHVQESDLEDAEYLYGKAHRNVRNRGTLNAELALFEAALTRQLTLPANASGQRPLFAPCSQGQLPRLLNPTPRLTQLRSDAPNLRLSLCQRRLACVD